MWTKLLDTYLLLQNQVDVQISMVLSALAASPYADNTIVVFCADHGEYGGAHGMRGKGFAFYDEGSRVPLVVKDPTNTWTTATNINRNQLVESVDLAALMLTLATGNNDWRGDSTYAQIAGRADIAGILGNPKAAGRPYIAHATDEPGTSSLLPTAQQLDPAANHITAVRTPHGKFARYAYWKDGTLDIDESKPIQYEAYNYATRAGRQELDNIYRQRGTSAQDKALVKRLDKLLDVAMQEEIQQPLPPALAPVQAQAMTDWFSQPPGEFTKHTDN
jgi:arylsulfatase A-like enzyme